ncbi:hypothetical protein D7316_04717 [Gordonia insulae]|uniref:Uncharacterized protein n=1 Tax=Gordonia insulae TaxID=2420509 RepID=A0A3G8JSJ4_9ACTN|nr:hypothetical protein D7316_04717 [Gordonia insulae]
MTAREYKSDTDRVVVWPDPSPLHKWWVSVMEYEQENSVVGHPASPSTNGAGDGRIDPSRCGYPVSAAPRRLEMEPQTDASADPGDEGWS